MNIVCRKGLLSDLPVLLEIEKKAIPTLQYLEGVKDEFFNNETGELVVAETEGKPIGFARFSLQYDGSGWLETLRVDPEYQKQGCGTAIWKRLMELCEIHQVPYVRMYTGLKNYASRVLGERNGLHVAYQVREGTLLAENIPAVQAPSFEKVSDAEEAERLIAPFAEGYHGYFCMNRSFYGLAKPLYEGLLQEGYLWKHGENCAAVGARFLKKQALHLGFMGGDLDACIPFAVEKLKESGRPKLVCVIPSEREDMRAALEKYGFTFPEAQIIVLERAFQR